MARWHDAHLAGRWYEGGAAALRDQVDTLLGAVPPGACGDVLALVVPHAGFAYSGRAAAHGYAALRHRAYERVVILAPSHHAGYHGVALLDYDGFETPLGRVCIDGEAVRELLRAPLFCADATPYGGEHALEIQLPFLRRVLPAARVVPLLVGALEGDDHESVAAALRPLEAPGTVFLVSSDLTHYGRRFDYLPFPSRDADTVRAGLHELDGGAIAHVCAGDPARFARYVRDTGATICGRTPIRTFLTLHRRRSVGQLLHYYTSLDVTGDFEHCVSYASIAFPRP